MWRAVTSAAHVELRGNDRKGGDMDFEPIIILMLLAFIFGLVIGFSLGRPNYPPRY